ncbi:TetR/AcrR family transcriptional regulator [Thalassorhabdomicrobium marinisediminis]|uniref:TetR/AcrR family transcriptional regulator n=1 Tax=Thalassorhabdomicrobium marinisediminis TaxID=2170577 RepID=A0A2T7FWM9_9RHOB|nr:TetR/AcrR family transcriptional regulator [Thalassorhabdomicrobium marinisediminis]PVA06576.1 TetR/AcrR family transcriptional regulator [Thalassorhabdomicrobium marinisediminis]
MARKQGSHAETTAPKVRDAALRLFARHGYAAVSMRQIAQEVGVQAGALYRYTPDKQHLLFDLMRSHMEALFEARQAYAQPSDPLARLDAFTTFHIRFHLQRVDAVFVSYMELRNLSPENFAEVARLRSRYEGELEAILRDGVAAGVFEIADCKITTLAIIAMLTGLTTWYREGGRLPLDEITALYVRMVRGAVGVV